MHMHGMDTQDDDDPWHTEQHHTHPQPYKQLLTGWIVGAAGLSNVSDSHPF